MDVLACRHGFAQALARPRLTKQNNARRYNSGRAPGKGGFPTVRRPPVIIISQRSKKCTTFLPPG